MKGGKQTVLGPFPVFAGQGKGDGFVHRGAQHVAGGDDLRLLDIRASQSLTFKAPDFGFQAGAHVFKVRNGTALRLLL